MDDRVKGWADDIPDEVLSRLQFFLNPNTDGRMVDEDGFKVLKGGTGKPDISTWDEKRLRRECWRKFNGSPQVNTAILGRMGRLTGMGFRTTSEIWDVQEVIDEISLDHRNRLWDHIPKIVGRSYVEGEINILLTLHDNGFVEADHIDPATIDEGGDDDTGIIFHSQKTWMPLFYNITPPPVSGRAKIPRKEQIPSIYIARYPSLLFDAKSHMDFSQHRQRASIDESKPNIGGYRRFIVSWNRGLLTRRATAYMRTTIRWLNHYEDLKLYEIDHKMASGMYAWMFYPEDMKAFRSWMNMSDEDKKKVAFTQKIFPGQRLVLPPGWKAECVSPNLPPLSGEDTDILDMVSSGFNEPVDVMTGRSTGTYASMKAQRGPMADRESDEAAYLERFLKYDFWSSVFFLRASVGAMEKRYPVQKCVGFDPKTKTEDWKEVFVPPERTIDIDFPVSEAMSIGDRVAAVMGAKHGNLSETMGMPRKRQAEAIGIRGYAAMRRDKATEDSKYPDLALTLNQESLQERLEAGAEEEKPIPVEE